MGTVWQPRRETVLDGGMDLGGIAVQFGDPGEIQFRGQAEF